MEQKSFEQQPISDERVIEALRARSADPEAESLIKRWYDESLASLDKVYEEQGSRAVAEASVRKAIERAALYYEAGLTSEAAADLEETCAAAASELFEGTSLLEDASLLLSRIKSEQ